MFVKSRFLSVFSVLMFLFSESVYAMLPVVDYAALAQLANQLTELKMQTQSIQQALHTLSGDQYQWSQTQPFLNQLSELMRNTQGLSYNTECMDATFQQSYPGYQRPANVGLQYQNRVNLAQHTFHGVFQSLGSQAAHFQQENTRLAFLQRQAQNAQGQTQAIQAGAQISSESVSQLQLLRQAVMTQTHAQNTYYATHVQQEASSRAEFETVLNNGSTQIPAYGSSGHALETPEFSG